MAIKPSPRLAVLLLMSHATAAVVAYMTMMPPLTKGVAFVLILLSLSCCLARDALLVLPGSWREISLEQDRLSVVTRNGSCFSGEVASGTAVMPHFAIVRIRPEGHRLPVSRIIFPDMIDAGEFRELRVRLRFSQ